MPGAVTDEHRFMNIIPLLSHGGALVLVLLVGAMAIVPTMLDLEATVEPRA